jgi:hypothetical protein
LKYPFTSRRKWTDPPEPFVTLILPLKSEASGTTALFARVCPGEKLIVLASGRGESPAKSVRKPGAVGPVTVALTETPQAPDGTPQDAAETTNSRVALG